MKNQTSRNEDDRVENRFNVNTLRQLQSNDRRNQGPMVNRIELSFFVEKRKLFVVLSDDEFSSTTNLGSRIGH